MKLRWWKGISSCTEYRIRWKLWKEIKTIEWGPFCADCKTKKELKCSSTES